SCDMSTIFMRYTAETRERTGSLIAAADHLYAAPDDQNAAQHRQGFTALSPAERQTAAQSADDENDSNDDVPHAWALSASIVKVPRIVPPSYTSDRPVATKKTR